MEPPFNIGPYKIVEQVGIGGMGRVYRGFAEDGREVAVKTMHPHLAELEDFVRRFMEEAERLQRVSHPGVVRVYDYGRAKIESTDLPYIAMEFVHGRKLSEIVGESQTGTAEFTIDVPVVDGKVIVPQEGVVRLLRQMAYILQACDQVSIVHRDIKPDNIIITDPTWSVKLIDFGIAKDTAERHTLSQTGRVLGTPAYMSPEQCKGLKEIDIRTDIYSLGIVAYLCLTGRLPFVAETVHGYIQKHLEEAPPPIREVNSSVDENLALIVERMMAKEPENRHRGPDELIEDLMRYERNEPPVKVYDWETRTVYETKADMEAARKAARRKAKLRTVLRLAGIATAAGVVSILLAFIIASRLRSQNPTDINLAKPLLDKANKLLKTLPEAAAFWYERACEKVDTPTIRQLLKDALKAADAAPSLLMPPNTKHKELIGRLINRHWAPIKVVKIQRLPSEMDWENPKKLVDPLRSRYGVRYLLYCKLTPEGNGYRAVLRRFDLRTGAEIEYTGSRRRPDESVEDAVLSAVWTPKQRRIHWLLIEARAEPTRNRKINLYKQVLNIDPSIKEAREALRRVYIEVLREYIKNERYQDAVVWVEEALGFFKADPEVTKLREEIDKKLRHIWVEQQIKEAEKALETKDWARAIAKAEEILKERDDERAKRIMETAKTLRKVSDDITSGRLKTAQRRIDEARRFRSLVPKVYDSLKSELKNALERYQKVIEKIKEALKQKRPQDVSVLVEKARGLNLEDTTPDELLQKAQSLLAAYNNLLAKAKKAKMDRLYRDALSFIVKAAELRYEGPHTKLKEEIESLLKERRQKEKKIEVLFKKGDWANLVKLARKITSFYPVSAYPKHFTRLANYAELMLKIESALRRDDLKSALDTVKRIAKIGIHHKREKEIIRTVRLRALTEMPLVQKSVELGGGVVCVCGAAETPFLLVGFSNGKFLLLTADGTKKLVFDPPKAGLRPLSAAMSEDRIILLWSDGSIHIRRSDGSFISSKKISPPKWACYAMGKLAFYDGENICFWGGKNRKVFLAGARLLGHNRFLIVTDEKGRIQVVDPLKARVRTLKYRPQKKVVSCDAWDDRVAIGLSDGTVEIRRYDGSLIKRVKSLRWVANAIVFDRGGKSIFVLDKHRAVLLLRADTGDVVWKKRLDCWSPAEACVVGLNDALAVRGEAGEVFLFLPQIR